MKAVTFIYLKNNVYIVVMLIYFTSKVGLMMLK